MGYNPRNNPVLVLPVDPDGDQLPTEVVKQLLLQEQLGDPLHQQQGHEDALHEGPYYIIVKVLKGKERSATL